jgi:hypothetical protein
VARRIGERADAVGSALRVSFLASGEGTCHIGRPMAPYRKKQSGEVEMEGEAGECCSDGKAGDLSGGVWGGGRGMASERCGWRRRDTLKEKK